MPIKQKLCKLYGQDTITVEDICIPFLMLIPLGIYMYGGSIFISGYIPNPSIGISDCFIIACLITFDVISIVLIAVMIIIVSSVIHIQIRKVWNKEVITCKKKGDKS